MLYLLSIYDNEEGGHMEGEETAVSGVPPLPAFAEHVSAEPPKPVAQLDAVPQTPLPEVIDFTPEVNKIYPET